MIISDAVTFDDVLLVPQYSEVLPSDVDLSTKIGRLTLSIPIFSAAMDKVTEYRMAQELSLLGGVGVIHKNMPPEHQSMQVDAVRKVNPLAITAAAVGVLATSQDRIDILANNDCSIIVVDTAHGHSKNVYKTVEYIKSRYANITVIAGNVATAEAVRYLHASGADAIKVGIGSGSICTTRMVAGVGVPQLTAVIECAKERRGMSIIADGGIRSSGDIVKAIAAGADAVMLGSILSGALESPGSFVEKGGKGYKEYRGMGSLSAMKKGSKDRYGQQNTENGKLVAEGVEAHVPYSGRVSDTINKLLGGIRSGMGYTGSKSISELQDNPKWVRISNSGLAESRVHSVTQDLEMD